MSAPPGVSVIIVSFEVRDLLRRCLETVRAQRGVAVETWVVDNASADGSPEMVAAEFPEAQLIRNPRNHGFAHGCNQALSRASGDVLLLLNPDTELPPGALAELVRVFARHPRAGAVGLALVNPDGSEQPWSFAFPGILNQLVEMAGLHRLAASLGYGCPSIAPSPRGGEGGVEYVSGACLALSRSAYATVGGLEEGLFLYGEESDWCWRAARAGFSTVGSRAVRVLHHMGASGVGQSGRLYLHNLQGRLAFLRRHRGAWRAAVSRAILVAGAAVRLVGWSVVAAAERRRGRLRPRTRDQLERFGAVWRTRLGEVE